MVAHQERSGGVGRVRGLATSPPDAVVRYAPHQDGIVDLHLDWSRPAGRLVVLLHGGFWRQAFDRRHTRAAAAALVSEGFVVATPEYRRVGGAGGWPTTVEDVDLAMSLLPGLLADLGVVTRGTTVLGHSAGGHLALWLAGTAHALDRVVGLAPVGDLRAAARERLGDGAIQALLGGEPEEVPERYAAADPLTRLADRPRCAVRVVHGTEDRNVPLSNSRGLVASHPWVALQVVGGADHFDVIDPSSAAWPVVLAALH